MELMSIWEEQAMERGVKVGQERGVIIGEANVILRQLRRHGQIPAELESRIRAMPLEKLERMADAVLDPRSIDDAAAWVDREMAS